MSSFDRVRPRRLEPVDQQPRMSVRAGDTTVDPAGRRALFSDPPNEPAAPFPAMALTCSSCGDESLVSVRDAVRLAVPSLHLPFVKRDYESWMKCPACGERTWVRARMRL